MRRSRPHVKADRGPMAKHDEDREKRLAEALRANLRRRKAQARGGVGPPRYGEGDRPAQPGGGGAGKESESND